ncbi:hypothetical protein [Mesorhizobium amorphae]|uniref:hypothetical protein n=1 Tax=Mesorhizobium amorphae TaxID=71433 RepID=UPI00031EAD77|nr:hypothetical protein [Mesorhizobium amorphae]GLR42969.1 hypothetical protein GCM10007880_34850 [Mesorhizobium amorphae]
METKYQSEEIWRKSLAIQRNNLAFAKREQLGAEMVSKIERRIERIMVAGLPEWREEENANRGTTRA